MKLKKNNTEILSSAARQTIEFLKNINDFLVVFSSTGEVLYSYSASSYTSTDYCAKITGLISDPVFNSSIKDGEYECEILVAKGTIKIKGSFLDKKKGNIFLAGNLHSELKKDSLLWDSFFSRNSFRFSPLIELLTGYDSAELNNFPGKGFYLLLPEEAEDIKTKISAFIVDSSNNNLELIYKMGSKNGQYLWMKEFVLVERDNSGSVINYSSSFAELTKFIEEKLFNEAVLAELQKLNSEKDQFISVLSHDLKSPYTSILGFSEILLNEASLSSGERQEYLSYINLSSQNQLKLINNLLEWSRLVTGKKQIDPVKINLKNIINNIISNNTRSIHKKNLDVRIIAESYFFVEADERLLTEALSVVITNAIKYSYSGKTIEIYLNRFRENQVELIIKDEGVGISEKNKDRILKMDQIFSTTGTSGERGTGISLLLAHEIIKSHKGEMWFYSEEGVGTEFHLTIPSAGNTILLIDENDSEKQKISNMLKTGFPGFRLSVEPNFYNALEKIKKDNPAIIVISHNLPFMNGMEFVKTLKKEEKFALTPIIVYSGDLTDKMTEEYKELGITEVLSAPVNLKVLRDKVEEYLK